MEFCISFACNYSLVDSISLDEELFLQACSPVDSDSKSSLQCLSLFNLLRHRDFAGVCVLMEVPNKPTPRVLTLHFQTRVVVNGCKLSVGVMLRGRRRRSNSILSRSLQGPPTTAGVTAATEALLLLCEPSSAARTNDRAKGGCTGHHDSNCHLRHSQNGTISCAVCKVLIQGAVQNFNETDEVYNKNTIG